MYVVLDLLAGVDGRRVLDICFSGDSEPEFRTAWMIGRGNDGKGSEGLEKGKGKANGKHDGKGLRGNEKGNDEGKGKEKRKNDGKSTWPTMA